MEWVEFERGAVALNEFGRGDGTSVADLSVLRALQLAEVVSVGGWCGGRAGECVLEGCGVPCCPIFRGTGDILGDSRGELLTSFTPGVLGGRWYPFIRGLAMVVVVGGGLRGGGPLGGPLGGPNGGPLGGFGADHAGVDWPFTREALGGGGPCGGL